MASPLKGLLPRPGLAAAVSLPFVLGVLTLRQRRFLSDVDWSPTGRTETQWPSLLALGPGGWLLTGTFVASSGLLAAQAISLFREASDIQGRAVSGLVGCCAVGLAGVSFTADLPGRADPSWHAQIHDHSYPLIPTSALAAAVTSAAASPAGMKPGYRMTSSVAAAAMVISLAGTSTDSIAQLSRYLLFTAIAAWLGSCTIKRPAAASGRAALPRDG